MKKWFALVLSLLMVLVLVSCGGGNTSSSAAPSGGDNTVYEFTFAHINADGSLQGEICEAWANAIEEASNGRIKFEFFWSGSICGPTEMLDGLENGSIDACWTSHSVYPGRFVACTAFSIPMLNVPMGADGGEAIYTAMMENESLAGEWEGLKLCAAYSNGYAVPAYTGAKVESIDDFAGYRLRVGNSAMISFVEAIQGVPMTFSTGDTYENIEKNVADGIIGDMDQIVTYRLYEPCEYIIDESIFSAIGEIIMSESAYNKLPDDLKAIVDEYSGVWASRLGGEMIADAYESYFETVKENGVEVYTASDELKADLKQAADAAVEAWIAEADTAGFDGRAIYEYLYELYN